MSFLSNLFKSNWQRAGESALGNWPVVHVHSKSGDVHLVIRHNTPADYRRTMRRAQWMTFGIAAAWCFFGYSLMTDAQKNQSSIDGKAAAIFVGLALVTLALPKYFANRKMKKDPMFGQTVTNFRIRKGMLLAPGGQKSAVEHFHSATGLENLTLKKELKDEELGKGRQQQLKKINRLLANSSCVEVRAGHRGAHLLHTVEFYNDAHLRWAGTAAAAIDYAVSLAKQAASVAEKPQSKSLFRGIAAAEETALREI